MLKNIIEALLFASGKGMSINELYDGLKDKYTKKDVDKAVSELKKQYNGDSGIIIIEYRDMIQMQTNPDYGELIADLLKNTKERELSKTLLQVLAIIAYKQPLTKQDIEDLRGGVNSDYVIAMLLKLDLIESRGKKDTVGHPILYGTTDEFLKKFNIGSVSELPDYEEIMFKIRNNYDKYYAKSQGLYHERNISDEDDEQNISNDADLEDIAAASDADDFGDELPDFLKDEDIIEIE